MKLCDARLRVATLECRKRPIRERRKPDVDLMNARHNLDNFTRQSEQLDAEIMRLDLSQYRRQSHLAAHDVDQQQIAAIDGVLRNRIREQVLRAVAQPPNYLLRTLGPRPGRGATDRAWIGAVVAVEGYRVEHEVTDRRSAIGAQPTGVEATLDWYAVHEKIGVAQELTVPMQRRPPVPSVEPPLARHRTRVVDPREDATKILQARTKVLPGNVGSTAPRSRESRDE